MDVGKLIDAYNSLAELSERDGADGRAVRAAQAALDALEADGFSQRDVDAVIAPGRDADAEDEIVQIATSDVRFRAFLNSETVVLSERGLSESAVQQTFNDLESARPAIIAARRGRWPVRLPSRREINDLRHRLLRNRRAVRRVILVAGGAIVIAVDVTFVPAPGKDVSIAGGALLIDRGFPELREWIRGHEDP